MPLRQGIHQRTFLSSRLYPLSRIRLHESIHPWLPGEKPPASPRIPREGEFASKRVGRTANPTSPPVEHVRVDHGGPNIFMTQKLLDRPYVVPILQQMSRKRMSTSFTRSFRHSIICIPLP